MERTISAELTSKKDYPPQLFFERFNMAVHTKMNYANILEKYSNLNPTLLIRKIGSFMLLHKDHIIEEDFYMNDFPDDNQEAEIVICENDHQAESEWIKYLSKIYPDKKIRTLNFFSTRSEESLKESLKNVSKITFSTTFTNYDWYEKIIKCMKPEQEIIGYCHNPSKWEHAKEISKNANLQIINKI